MYFFKKAVCICTTGVCFSALKHYRQVEREVQDEIMENIGIKVCGEEGKHQRNRWKQKETEGEGNNQERERSAMWPLRQVMREVLTSVQYLVNKHCSKNRGSGWVTAEIRFSRVETWLRMKEQPYKNSLNYFWRLLSPHTMKLRSMKLEHVLRLCKKKNNGWSNIFLNIRR